MSQSEYAFQFIGTDTTCADQILMDTLIYTFRSAKSGHQYQVNIERYADHLCGVKFFDRTSDTRIGKFSKLSDTYEPRTIFRTVANIALDAYRRDTLSSFFLIGAADSRDRKTATTRRFRVYVAFVNNLNLTRLFRIIEVKDQSMIVLLNRLAVADMDAYMQKILDFVV
jgi:hypothetical protein